MAEVYPRLVEKYPAPAGLARAPQAEIKTLIKPLGMEHRRSRLLKELAKQLVERFGGRVPESLGELKSLPGVGDYTAREVLCLAYDRPQPMLDRNMIRVLERALGVKSRKKRPHTDPDLWKIAAALVPRNSA